MAETASETNRKALLEAEDLKKTFSGRRTDAFAAVDGVSFRLFPGEILGIAGESGCGKTTLARMLARLLEPDSGEIFLEGKKISGPGGRSVREICRTIQMVFQNPAASFDPRRTLGYSVSEGLRNSGMAKKAAAEKARALLEQCGLPGSLAGRYPHEVSIGQCQRAAIARAIAVGPKILICDEATASLDVTVQRQIISLLSELREQTGMSYLFISHDLALMQMFCSRLLVMHDGTIIEEGTPDDVIGSPREEYTRKLIHSVLL